jgi:hypothetical protein
LTFIYFIDRKSHTPHLASKSSKFEVMRTCEFDEKFSSIQRKNPLRIGLCENLKFRMQDPLKFKAFGPVHSASQSFRSRNSRQKQQNPRTKEFLNPVFLIHISLLRVATTALPSTPQSLLTSLEVQAVFQRSEHLMSTFPPRPCPCLCPLCGSLQVVQRCWGRKTGGFVGSLAGAAGGFAGSLRGAQIGGITGALLGPAGISIGGLAGAVLGGLVGSSIGCEVGSAVGETIDAHVLNDFKCQECGHSFAHSHSSSL